eukprot:11823216-Alexandrium_andersonii.AAC.1
MHAHTHHTQSTVTGSDAHRRTGKQAYNHTDTQAHRHKHTGTGTQVQTPTPAHRLMITTTNKKAHTTYRTTDTV